MIAAKGNPLVTHGETCVTDCATNVGLLKSQASGAASSIAPKRKLVRAALPLLSALEHAVEVDAVHAGELGGPGDVAPGQGEEVV